jgi:hypothetical protein
MDIDYKEQKSLKMTVQITLVQLITLHIIGKRIDPEGPTHNRYNE